MKNSTTTIYFILILILPIILFGQDFDEGYDHLNKGQYAEALVFFTKAIEDFPENKTAKICFGRAMGLNGDPKTAINTFNKLVTEYPNDKESLLNLAESYLWNQEAKKAIDLYKKLYAKYPTDKLILRSLANAYALDLNYKLAFNHASNCLKLDPSNNSSKDVYRTIGLAYAHELKTAKNYTESKSILTQLEQLFPNNKNIIISKAYALLAERYFSEAEFEFLKLQTQDLDPIRSLLGLASISLQKGKTKKSISYLENTVLEDSKLTAQQKAEKWDLLFGNYLSTNPKKAATILVKLKDYLSLAQFSEKQIYLYLEQENYDAIQSNIGNIEDLTIKQNIKLRVALESNQYHDYDSIIENIDYQIADRYTHSLIQKLKSQQSNKVTSHFELAKDNGNNFSKNIAVVFQDARAKTFSSYAKVSSRWLDNTILKLGTSNHSIVLLGTNITVNRTDIFTIGVGLESIKNIEQSSRFIPTYDISYKHQFSKRHFTRIFSLKKQLDYNQDLFGQNINKYHFGIEHHITSRSNLGSYSQLNLILLTDDNVGFDMFNSLYINLKNNPIIQTGINSTFLSYQVNKVEYFSPKSLISISPFLKISNEYSPNTNFKYSLMTSVGKQLDLNNSSSNQFIYTFQGKAGYHLNRQIYLEWFYTYANNSSALNNGFSTYYTGLNAKFSLL